MIHRIPRPSCIALDYDFTVARFHGGFEGLHQILVRQGISPEDAKRAHDLAETRGFTPALYLECAAELGFTVPDQARFSREFREWLDAELHLYPEMTQVAREWSDFPFHIVSFGNAEYQGAKIASTCIPHVDARIVQQPKVYTLRELHRQYGGPIWFFDDNPHEHDAVRDAGLTDNAVICLFVDRAESPHNHKTPKYDHRRISNLLDARWE